MDNPNRPSALDVTEIGALITKLSDKWLAETQSDAAILPMPRYRASATRDGNAGDLPRIVTNTATPPTKRRPFYTSLMAALRRAAVPAAGVAEPYLARPTLATRGTLQGDAYLPPMPRSREARVRPPLSEPVALRRARDCPLARTESAVQGPCVAVARSPSAPAPSLCTGLRGDPLPRAVEPARRTTEAATLLFRQAFGCARPAEATPDMGNAWHERHSLLTAPVAANGDRGRLRQPSLAGLVDKATAESLAPLLKQWVSDTVAEAVSQALPTLNGYDAPMGQTDVLR